MIRLGRKWGKSPAPSAGPALVIGPWPTPPTPGGGRFAGGLDPTVVDRYFTPPEMARVAAEQEHPRLGVSWDCPGRWAWSVTGPSACVLDSGHADTHAEALAVGLAALEAASLAEMKCPLCALCDLSTSICRDVNPPR